MSSLAFVRRLSASFLLVSILSLLALSPKASAQPAEVEYPFPRNNARVFVEPAEFSVDSSNSGDQRKGYATGRKTLTFHDVDNGPGTTYEVFVWREGDPIPTTPVSGLSPAAKTEPAGTVQAFSLTLSDVEVNAVEQMPTSSLTQGWYNWRVDVTSGGQTTTGQTWRFDVPMGEPSPGSTRVGVHVPLVWDQSPDPAQRALRYEKVHLKLASDSTPWRIGGAYQHKVGPDIDTTRWDFLRQYINTTALQPGRTYLWRVSYAPSTGNSHDSWADGGGDGPSEGWRFTTVPTITIWGEGIRGEDHSAGLESIVIYYESPWGTLTRDGIERAPDFKAQAKFIAEQIHENENLGPDASVPTRYYGTEEILASYAGTVGSVPSPTGWPGSDTEDWQQTRTYDDDYYRHKIPRQWWRVGKAIRAMLADTGTGPFGGTYFYYPNLQYIVLLGDVRRLPASFYYESSYSGLDRYGSTNTYNFPTDFFYSTVNRTTAISTTPHFQVSRIPMRRVRYETTDRDGNPAWFDELGIPHDNDPFAQVPNRYQIMPALFKMKNYQYHLRQDQSPEERAALYRNWYGRCVFAVGSTGYRQWFQFYNAVAQHILNQTLPDGTDFFRGLLVRKYDFFFPNDGTYEEGYTRDNVLRHLRNVADNALGSSAKDHVGFAYLLSRGYDEEDLMPIGATIGVPSHTHIGRHNVTLHPKDGPVRPHHDFTVSRKAIDPADFSPVDGGNVLDWRFPGEDPSDDWRRPIVVSSAAYAGRTDIAVFDYDSLAEWDKLRRSLGEAMVRSPGGPVAFIGFTSPRYSWERDEDGGFIQPTITHGQVTLGGTDPIVGKSEFVMLFAKHYQQSAQPHLGNVFNAALQEYVETHQDELTTTEVATTMFGAHLLGDSAMFVMQRPTAPSRATTSSTCRSTNSPATWTRTACP